MAERSTSLRFARASFVAAIPLLLLLALDCLWVIFYSPGHTPAGDLDDGPVRGAYIFFLFGWPIIYALLVICVYFATQILSIMGWLSRTGVMRSGLLGIVVLTLASAMIVRGLTASERVLEFLSTCLPTAFAFAWATSLWFRIAAAPRPQLCVGPGH